eukprot:tig00000760_g3923.t1
MPLGLAAGVRPLTRGFFRGAHASLKPSARSAPTARYHETPRGYAAARSAALQRAALAEPAASIVLDGEVACEACVCSGRTLSCPGAQLVFTLARGGAAAASLKPPHAPGASWSCTVASAAQLSAPHAAFPQRSLSSGPARPARRGVRERDRSDDEEGDVPWDEADGEAPPEADEEEEEAGRPRRAWESSLAEVQARRPRAQGAGPPEYHAWGKSIAAALREGNSKTAEKVLAEAAERGVPLTTYMYNIVIEACILGKRPQRAREVYQEMLARGVPPDVVTLNTLLKVYEPSPEGAVELIASFEKHGVFPNEATFKTLMKWAVYALDIESAERTFFAMRTAGLQPKLPTYKALIKGYTMVRQFEGAKRLLEEMAAEGVPPDEESFNLVIAALAGAGQLDEAEALLASMRARGAAPSHASFAPVITGYVTAGDEARALRLFWSMRDEGVPYEPDAANVLLQRLASKWGALDRIDATAALLREFAQKGVPLDERSFAIVAGGLTRRGRYDEARALLAEMPAHGLRAEAATYNALISALVEGRRFEAAMATLAEMRAAGLAPSRETFNALLLGSAGSGREADAALIMEQI